MRALILNRLPRRWGVAITLVLLGCGRNHPPPPPDGGGEAASAGAPEAGEGGTPSVGGTGNAGMPSAGEAGAGAPHGGRAGAGAGGGGAGAGSGGAGAGSGGRGGSGGSGESGVGGVMTGGRGGAGGTVGGGAGIESGGTSGTAGGGFGGGSGDGASAGTGGTLPDPCAGITCDGHGACEASFGAPICRCSPGYEAPSGNPLACTDIDECATNEGGCDPLTLCTNVAGGRTCSACPRGYGGSGETGCVAKVCDGAPDTDCACLLVTPDGDDEEAMFSNGTLPFATVQSAIDFAATHARLAQKVCIAGGPECRPTGVVTFPGVPGADLTMRDGVSVYGGYETTHLTRCLTTELALTSPAGVLFDASVQHPTVLDRVWLSRFDAPTTAGVTIRGARGVTVSGVGILGGGSAVNVTGVDVSDGAEAKLSVAVNGYPLNPTGTHFGIRAVGSMVQVSGFRSDELRSNAPEATVSAIWLENAAGSSVTNSSAQVGPNSLAQNTGIHVQGSGVTLGPNQVRLGGPGVGVELVDAGPTTVTGSISVTGDSQSVGVRALRSSVSVWAPVQLTGTATAIFLDAAPGSYVQTTITGYGRGILVRGDATGTEVRSTTVNVSGDTALSFADCGGAAPLVTASSFTATSPTSLGYVDTISSGGNCHPRLIGNSTIVSSGMNGGHLNAVRCAAGSQCEIIGNRNIHVENGTLPLRPGDFTTSAGIRCDEGSCGDITDNSVSGLTTPPGCQRNCNYYGGGVFSGGGLVARNVIAAGCTGNGAGLSATGGRIENNRITGPTCGGSGGPRVGIALDLTGGYADVHSNLIAGSYATDYPLAGSPLCYTAGIRTSGGTFRNNSISGGRPECEGGSVSVFFGTFQNNAFSLPLNVGGITSIDALNEQQPNAGNFAGLCDLLWADSPCVDAGTTSGAPSDDIEGQLRDASPDVGPDEFNGAPPVDPCADVTCPGQGVCTPVGQAAVCQCATGYLGPDCTAPDVCTTNNGGCDSLVKCTPFPGGRTCGSCPTGYGGSGDAGCYVMFNTLEAGDGFSCGVRYDGRVLCWGTNALGETNGPAIDASYDTLSVGGHDACALTSYDTLVCWGYSAQGVTYPPSGNYYGVSVSDDFACATASSSASEPTICWGAAPAPPAVHFGVVETGTWHACGILDDQSLLCWGLSGGPNDVGQATPPPGQFKALSVAARTSCALALDGSIVCWGTSLGDAPPPSGAFEALAINDDTGCAVSSDSHQLTCWGSNAHGLAEPPAINYTIEVTMGATHACALDSGRRAYCWGDNTYGQATPPVR